MTSLPANSRRVIRADDPAFAFHTSNLPYFLAGKFQPDASLHAIRFLDYDHSEMFQTPVHRLDVKAGLELCAATCLQQMERLDGNSRGFSKVCLADAGHGTSCRDYTGVIRILSLILVTPFLRGSLGR